VSLIIIGLLSQVQVFGLPVGGMQGHHVLALHQVLQLVRGTRQAGGTEHYVHQSLLRQLHLVSGHVIRRANVVLDRSPYVWQTSECLYLF
jgi:hypothetical protein